MRYRAWAGVHTLFPCVRACVSASARPCAWGGRALTSRCMACWVAGREERLSFDEELHSSEDEEESPLAGPHAAHHSSHVGKHQMRCVAPLTLRADVVPAASRPPGCALVVRSCQGSTLRSVCLLMCMRARSCILAALQYASVLNTPTRHMLTAATHDARTPQRLHAIRRATPLSSPFPPRPPALGPPAGVIAATSPLPRKATSSRPRRQSTHPPCSGVCPVPRPHALAAVGAACFVCAHGAQPATRESCSTRAIVSLLRPVSRQFW